LVTALVLVVLVGAAITYVVVRLGTWLGGWWWVEGLRRRTSTRPTARCVGQRAGACVL
jgi:hypothetical protein